MKKNKLLIALLSLSFVTATVFALGGIAVSADDDDLIDSGVCGANLIWSLDTDYKLTISGSGAMTNFDDMGSPWLIYGAGRPSGSRAPAGASARIRHYLSCMRILYNILAENASEKFK